jgi:hypothetical protein
MSGSPTLPKDQLKPRMDAMAKSKKKSKKKAKK